MVYTETIGNNFWYEFDQVFLFDRPNDIDDAFFDIDPAIGQFAIIRAWRNSRRDGTYPASFTTYVDTIKNPVLVLANKQKEIIENHFGSDLDDLRSAFEDFGQGVLYDDRRTPRQKIHKMNSGNVPGMPGNPSEYHSWHSFCVGCTLIEHDAEFWLKIARLNGLAWEIQSIMRPFVDDRNNARMPAAKLVELRNKWLIKSLDELDSEFDSNPLPAGAPPAPAPA